jgi:uncharacterized lipoprotein YddW (UPF0748 family)
VSRFNAQYGRMGQPDPNDPQWGQFRRDQVTDLLRTIREAALGARPGIKVSAALVPWGNGPANDNEWMRGAAYSYVFQDWRSWLEQGLIDQGYPMNYMRESSPAQAGWLDRWLAWQRSRSYGRQVIAGLGIYLNQPADSLRQVRRALAPGPDGSRLAGVAFYSYAVPEAEQSEAETTSSASNGAIWDLLTRPRPDNEFNPPFSEYVASPGRH